MLSASFNQEELSNLTEVHNENETVDKVKKNKEQEFEFVKPQQVIKPSLKVFTPIKTRLNKKPQRVQLSDEIQQHQQHQKALEVKSVLTTPIKDREDWDCRFTISEKKPKNSGMDDYTPVKKLNTSKKSSPVTPRYLSYSNEPVNQLRGRKSSSDLLYSNKQQSNVTRAKENSGKTLQAKKNDKIYDTDEELSKLTKHFLKLSETEKAEDVLADGNLGEFESKLIEKTKKIKKLDKLLEIIEKEKEKEMQMK
ncbi:hypothetical protein HDU92_002319 [Lobulomyces angularis]|nr:hypothetical protein HDU92_002319 [Lobulomyces angularis]